MKHKVNKKVFRRTLSLILVITMSVTGLGLDMMAESVYATQKTETVEKSKKKELTVVKELTDERTENSNTYLMSDGSKQLEIFSEDIRYKKNGKLLKYDSSLIENKNDIIVKKKSFAKADEYAYVNTAGDCKQYIPEELDDDTPVVLTKGGNVISFTPVYDTADEKIDAKVAEIQNEKITDNENTKTEQRNAPDVKLTKTDRVKYKKENIVYEFISENNGIKENVIFERKPKKYDVSYEFKMPNLYLEYSKDTNQIYVISNTNNKIVAYISSPFLNDNTGINFNYDITTSVEQRDEKWIVTYKLPKQYFENKKTEYPVVLDPSVWWDSENNIEIRETLNVGGSANSVIDSSSRFMLANLDSGTGTGGSGAQVNVRFKNLHNILKGKYISYSYFDMVKESKSGTPKFSIYPITENWNYYTTTWNNKPSVSDESVCDMNITNDSDTIQPWLTNWVRKLSSGEINNDYGIAFYPQENSEYFWLWFYGLSATNSANGTGRKPTLIVNYKDVEDINAAYDGTFQIEGSYEEENKKIELSWESYNDDIDRYDLYIRKNDNNHFEYAGCTTETNISYDVESGIETYDFRVVAVNEGQIDQYGEYDTQYLSNICSFKKDVDETIQSDESNSVVEVYNLNVKDTDDDGLEDGYEIWDFKTLWNTETGIDEEGNKIYDLDTDNDGFPDSYEVFTLGTNPTVANTETNDSDNDGLSDLEEYAKGTDPWLPNSDFDGVGDSGDSTPRRTNGYTRSHVAYAASVHKGLYDKEYSMTEGDVTVSYITNMYRGEIKQIYYDYGDANLNKKIKYFYDANGNNTAMVEQYDSDYVPNDSNTNLTGEDQVICVTYTYDSENNVTFICDQSTKYNMSYDDAGNISSFYVGNYNLIQNDVTTTINHSNASDENTDETTYGNGQKVKKVISEYEVTNTNSIAKIEEIYFSKTVNGVANVYGTNADYILKYDEEGQLVNFVDYTKSVNNPIQYQYSYTDTGSVVTRNDGFSKTIEVTESKDENSKITTYTTNKSYSFTNLKGDTADINESFVTNDDNSNTTKTLYIGDLYTSSTDKEEGKAITESKIHSNIFNIDILTSTETENSNTSRNYRIEAYNSEKSIDYVYDNAGNITRIIIGENVAYEYTYDPHDRLVTEKDYVDCKFYRYNYGDSANVHSKNIWDLDTNGNKINSTKQTIYLTYDDGDNAQWQDQLKSYNGQSITYDGMGNPLSYINGMSFAWSRGRQLDKVTFSNNTTASYTYNENGLRTHKETNTESVEYTWDDSSLIREVVILKDTNKTYDVWYLYDENDSPVGFMYYQLINIGSNEHLSLGRYYYEKDLQGNIIGILDAHGYEVATYSYDAWGNITDTTYTSQLPYQLNHLTYRGYYRDEETGFYYLQSRYYDAEVGRFLNADDIKFLDMAENMVSKNNLYCYCNCNPVNNIDPEGNLMLAIQTKISWKKSNKQRKNDYFTIVLSEWYKASEFETITLNKGYSVSASVSAGFGVSAKAVSASVGLSNSFTISSNASGTHKVKKKKGRYVRFVGKVDAYVWDVKKTTTSYICYFIKVGTLSKKGKLYVPIKKTLSVGVKYSDKKY